MAATAEPALAPRIWAVGALCRAIADSLEARFNPVAVRGEVSGFTRAASGHCYFTLKDAQGQVRCALFRRSAGLLDFTPRDGEAVEAFGRLGVYEPRGELQLVVESLRRAGQGALFEQFLRLKERLQAEGLFDSARKRPLPALPRGIGIVTSPGAAALHDVLTCLKRRAPHVPVLLAPASVQGSQAPAELAAALGSLFAVAARGEIDLILLVRGGGSLEDLWAFNDEQLARTIVRSPVPVVSGVGHETDFTIADFCADLRAPTPTAAAELAASPRQQWLDALAQLDDGLRTVLLRRLDAAGQRLDQAAQRLGRPSAHTAQQQQRLGRAAARLRLAMHGRLQHAGAGLGERAADWRRAVRERLDGSRQRIERLGLQLGMLDPRRVLERGYALLTDRDGHVVTSVRQTRAGQSLTAALADGEVAVTVSPPPANHP